MTALQLSPVVKFRGFELFAMLGAGGRVNRKFRQHAIDVIHRFFKTTDLFVGVRLQQSGGPVARGLRMR